MSSADQVRIADPQDVADYAWNFGPLLDVGDALTGTPTVTPPTGIDLAAGKPSPAIVGTKVVAWLAGGVVDQKYDVVAHVLTTGGRAFDLTLTLWIQQR